MMNLLKHLTGGRPMTFVEKSYHDDFNLVQINVYKDAFNRKWLASSRWALFRVRWDF